MGRNHRAAGKKPKKLKNQRKKQKALVDRCVQALNSNVAGFRARLEMPPNANHSVAVDTDVKLLHFKPVCFEDASGAIMSEAINMLESQFNLGDENEKSDGIQKPPSS